MQLPRSYHYKRKFRDDAQIQDALNALISKHPAIGFWQSYHRFRNRGEQWNHKRARRILSGNEIKYPAKSKEAVTRKSKAAAGGSRQPGPRLEY